MVEVTGVVQQKKRDRMMRPGVVKPDPNAILYIPIFRLRILVPSEKVMQVLYKGDPPGDVEAGDIVHVKGVEKGGIIHAENIYNLTTDSWVTPRPGFFQRILGG